MSQIPPPVPASSAPSPKKKGLPVLAWVAIGCGGLLVIAIGVVVAGGFFVARTVGQAAKDPGMAAAKLMVAANPELEIVSSDTEAGTITIRNKKTGEVITMDLSDVKQGKIDFTGPKGEKVTLEADGGQDQGILSIQSDAGSFTLGGGSAAERPDWVPDYPDSSPEGTFSMTEGDKKAGGFQFTTGDTPEAVMDRYEAAFKGAGFEVNKHAYSGGGSTGGVVDARKGERHASVSVASGDDGTTVMVNFEEKPGE